MSLSKIRKNGHGEWKHAHQLEWKMNTYQKTFTCDGCKVLGIGARYRCDGCDYDLHKVCHEAQSYSMNMIISHDHFPGDTFEFLQVPPLSPSGKPRCCDACGKRVLGFVYHCKERGWDLHPCCSNLKTKIHVDGTDFVLHVGMWQPAGSTNYKCMWCKKRTLEGTKKHVPGWSYVSSCEDICRMHVYCFTEMVRGAWDQGELLIDQEGESSGTATHDQEAEGSVLVKLKPALWTLARKNIGSAAGRSRNLGHEFLRKAELFVRTLVGLMFGDPTVVLATAFFQFLSQ